MMATRAADTADTSESAPLCGTKVLVVDDNADARELTAIVLEMAGAHVDQAESVEAAMNILKGQRFTVLVSDISMPVADGYELIRRVRGAAPRSVCALPAVAVTALDETSERLRLYTAGFQEYLPKPFEPSELVAVVRRLARS